MRNQLLVNERAPSCCAALKLQRDWINADSYQTQWVMDCLTNPNWFFRGRRRGDWQGGHLQAQPWPGATPAWQGTHHRCHWGPSPIPLGPLLPRSVNTWAEMEVKAGNSPLPEANDGTRAELAKGKPGWEHKGKLLRSWGMQLLVLILQQTAPHQTPNLAHCHLSLISWVPMYHTMRNPMQIRCICLGILETSHGDEAQETVCLELCWDAWRLCRLQALLFLLPEPSRPTGCLCWRQKEESWATCVPVKSCLWGSASSTTACAHPESILWYYFACPFIPALELFKFSSPLKCMA